MISFCQLTGAGKSERLQQRLHHAHGDGSIVVVTAVNFVSQDGEVGL